MITWLADLRFHSISGLPSSDSTVQLRVLDQPCASASSLDGVAFLGAWTRRAVYENSTGMELEMECCTKGRKLLASGKLPLGGGGSMAQSSAWQNVELPLDWRAGHGNGVRAHPMHQGAHTMGVARHARTCAWFHGAKCDAKQAAGAAAGALGDHNKLAAEGEGFAAKRPCVRLSYRVVPESQAEAGRVPECSNEPVELPVTPLERLAHCYAHGGFMGLAVSMMADANWRNILQREDPESHKKAHELYAQLLQKEAHPNKRLGVLMTCLENSPVLCAYGLMRSGCTAPVRTKIPTAESAASKVTACPGSCAVEGGLAGEPSTTSHGAAADGALPALRGGGNEAVAPGAGGELGRLQQTDDGASVLEAPHLSRVFRSRTRQLDDYLASLRTPNIFGYQPMALEWDLWIHPTQPASLQHATVDHGSAGQLITQAITAAVPGLKGVAKKAGINQIQECGISPVFWMNALGHSLNQAVNGDRAVPLPLEGKQEQFYRLSVTVLRAQGGVLSHPELWDKLYVKGLVDSAAVVVPVDRTRETEVQPGEGCLWNQDLIFWPLPLGLEQTDLLVEVRGDPKGLRRDKALGMVRLPLLPLLRRHSDLVDAQRHVELELPLGPKQQRYIHQPSKGYVVPGPEGEVAVTPGSAGEDESDDEDQAGALAAVAAEERGCIRLRFRFEVAGTLAAAESIGVTPAAAQTCLAMLSKPGGLYLDIKSAYSTPQDIRQFVTTLAGIGVHCKAVCSFQRRQLDVGGLADSVLFFHGISGLENSCDDSVVERGQFVLFNGASFLADLKPAALKGFPATKVREALRLCREFPIDPIVLRKYIGLCETYGFAGGIYVQEPDASAASVSALAQLVTDHAEYFPLGFAYGHLSGLGVNFVDQGGRGFASQQVLEELQSRKELTNKVMERIKKGKHRQASLATCIAWGHRIVFGSDEMNLAEQRTFVALLSQVWPHRNVAKVVDELGGVRTIFLRSFHHYKLTAPLALLESKLHAPTPLAQLLQLLRDRGVVAGKPLEEKVELAQFFFCSGQLRGAGITSLLKSVVGAHAGMHKFAKEGLLCVLESCTRDEYDQVASALGGRAQLEKGIRAKGTGHSSRRLHHLLQALDVHPEQPAYLAQAGAGSQQTE